MGTLKTIAKKCESSVEFDLDENKKESMDEQISVKQKY